MTHMVLHIFLFTIFIFCTIINSIEADKFIGEYLKSQVKHYLLSASNNTNHKMWMEYLEKRLDKMYTTERQPRKRQIFSVLQFYKGNIQSKLLKNANELCFNQHEKLHTGIFGSICASEKNGVHLIPAHGICKTHNANESIDCFLNRG